MTLALALTVSVFLTNSSKAKAVVKVCSNTDGYKAERDIGRLHNWQQVYNSFRLYVGCDDGSVAEGYSHLIVNTLVGHWEWTIKLSRLAQTDPKFRIFVMKHLDITMTPNQAQYIALNAHKNCPNGAAAFCRKIALQIDNLK